MTNDRAIFRDSLSIIVLVAMLSCFACSKKESGNKAEPDKAEDTQAAAQAADPGPTCDTGPALAKKSFGKAVQISTKDGKSTSDTEVSAAVDGQGNLTAAYIARMGNIFPNPLGVSTVAVDGSVDMNRQLTGDRQRHYDPWMARDRDGRLYLVWLAFDGMSAPEKNMHVGFATSDDGKTWSEITSAWDADTDCPGTVEGCVDKPMMAIGPDKDNLDSDAIYVAYWSKPEQKQKVVKSVDGGKTFGKSVVASENVYGDIWVDAAGDVHIVNVAAAPGSDENDEDPDTVVEYVRSSDGGKSFTAPMVASESGKNIIDTAPNPQIVVDSERGITYVVYPGGDSATHTADIMLAISKDAGKTWTYRKVNDDPTCANHMLPAAVLDPKDGRVHIMWVENRNEAGQVAYAVCDAESCSANELVSDAPFAAYDFKRHTNTWLGEYNELALDNDRRVLHAVWAQPVMEAGEDGEPHARIFHAQRSLP